MTLFGRNHLWANVCLLVLTSLVINPIDKCFSIDDLITAVGAHDEGRVTIKHICALFI